MEGDTELGVPAGAVLEATDHQWGPLVPAEPEGVQRGRADLLEHVRAQRLHWNRVASTSLGTVPASTVFAMSKIAVFGAGGRAGRAVVDEALRREHQVVSVVRNPADHPDVDGIAGDVTSVADVSRLAGEVDAVVAAVYDPGTPDFFRVAAGALVKGVNGRLIWVGLASILPTASGELLMDSTSYPQEYRAFFLAHAAAIEVFNSSDVDWVSIAPSGDFDHENPDRTGSYRLAPADAALRISYADLAIAVLDEIDDPRHHRTLLGVSSGTMTG